jgi:hypothetical protein
MVLGCECVHPITLQLLLFAAIGLAAGACATAESVDSEPGSGAGYAGDGGSAGSGGLGGTGAGGA